MREPELFERLIALLTEATVDYLSAQVEAGAEAVMLFDSWAGMLSPAQFRRHVIEPTREDRRTRCGSVIRTVPIIGFPRLAGRAGRRVCGGTGVDGVGVDTGMDLARGRSAGPGAHGAAGQSRSAGTGRRRAGVAARDGGDPAALRGRPFIFNLGHGIVPQTPPEHVAALVEQVRAA